MCKSIGLKIFFFRDFWGHFLAGKIGPHLTTTAQKVKSVALMDSLGVFMTWTWGSDSIFNMLKIGHKTLRENPRSN